jgi:hypothetical protein
VGLEVLLKGLPNGAASHNQYVLCPDAAFNAPEILVLEYGAQRQQANQAQDHRCPEHHAWGRLFVDQEPNDDRQH